MKIIAEESFKCVSRWIFAYSYTLLFTTIF